MQLSPNEILCKEGEFRNALYIVKKGVLEGTSLHGHKKSTYEPGSIIGEFSLVENGPCTETITAIAESEIQTVSSSTLQETLTQEPTWVGAIVNFLSKRSHVAQRDLRSHKKIKSLPGLLYVLKNKSIADEGLVNLSTIQFKMTNLLELSTDILQELLHILEDLDLLKIQGDSIKIKSANVIELLYQAILHRATQKTTSPHILSLTEQMVLTAVIKAIQESNEPLQNGSFVVSSQALVSVAKKATHGMTLTTRNVKPLLDKNILQCSSGSTIDTNTPIESVEQFKGDFDYILDLMELNRVYPLLDKKLLS